MKPMSKAPLQPCAKNGMSQLWRRDCFSTIQAPAYASERHRLSAATFHPNAMRPNGISSQIAAISICSLSALAAIFYIAPLPSLPWSEPAVEFMPEANPSKGMIAPSPPTFKIVFSDGDRGLMVYGGYVYVVRVGDKLPDGSRAVGFEKREGSWSAMTL